MDYPVKTLQQLRPLLVGYRKQAGLSQAALAALLGISQQSYAKIEANPASTSVERLFTILRLLGTDMVLTSRPPAPDGIVPAQAPPTPTANKPRAPAPPKMLPPSKNKEQW